MKKLLVIAALLAGFVSNAQDYDCEDLKNDIERYGSKLDSDWYFDSSALSEIEWYRYSDSYYAIIEFTSSWDKYVYGRWNKNAYDQIKDGFEWDVIFEGSAGKAFHAWIRPNSNVGCLAD